MVAVAAALTILGLLLVTAIASREPLNGIGQTVTPPDLPYGQSEINAPPWALALIGAGALIALVGVLVTIRWQAPRRRKRDEEAPRRVIQFPLAAKLVALLVPLLLGAVLVVAAIEGSRARTPIIPGRGGLLPRAGKARKPRPFTSYSAPTWILPSVLGVVLGGGGVVLLVIAMRRRLDERPELAPAFGAAATLDEAVAASLDDLRNEPDPRRAVIAAYRRMETTLADAGLPRRAWEAPREYSGRVHNYLELSARPLQTLTVLFEQARFGVGRVGESLREQAIAALVALHEELAELTTDGREAA